jgi:serine/threonine protein kinase
MSRELQLKQVIDGRYRILDILGNGQSGITYRAEYLNTSTIVALKVLSLRDIQNWKLVELFEREALVLQTLEHPAIPRYLESFVLDTEDDRYFFIAQTLAEGKNLAQWVESGWRPIESEVRDLAGQMLNILRYLQQLNPPIVHRDIKPQNIMRREDGQIFLVDFGAVAHTYQNTLMRGSTVVGTFGYMAPEQFRSQAYPASDLYGLGATLLFVLTHRSPAELPTTKLRLQFRDRLRVSEPFCDWLEQLLEPNLKLRFAHAAEALAALPKAGKHNRNPSRFSISKFSIAVLILLVLPFSALKVLSENKYAILSVISDRTAVYAELEMERISLNDYLNQGGRWFMTPQRRAELLPIAWQTRDWLLAEEWLQEGVDLYRNRPNGNGLLHSAIQLDQGSLVAIKQLYRYHPRIDWNQLDQQKQTPLTIAKTEEIALLLLSKGADPTVKTSNDKLWIQFAIEKDWKKVIAKLNKDKSTKGIAGINSLLITPIYQGNLSILKMLVQSGHRLTKKDVGEIAFQDFQFKALQEGQVNWFIKALPNIDWTDRYQMTLLHHTASRQNLALMKQVLASGANPNARSSEGSTALHSWAIIYGGNLEIGKLLLKHGADPNIAAADGRTPLHIAVTAENYAIAKLLLESGAKPTIRDNRGMTPIDSASSNFRRNPSSNSSNLEQLFRNSAQ